MGPRPPLIRPMMAESDTGGGVGAGDALPTPLLISCGIAVAFATGMSLFSIILHLKNYRKPLLQRMVIRILVMVPIYGISSLIAIFSLDAAFIIDAIRDVYEAFVIYCFFQLLLAYLGGERSLLILLHGRQAKAPVFPLNLFWSEIDVSDPYTFLFLKRGIMQYVQVKPVLAVFTVVCKAFGIYNEGDFTAKGGYLYVSIVYNFSIFLSLYCLAMFWVCVHDDILPFRPMPKFICIKGIIFFSFWQAICISIMVAAHAITKFGPYTDSEHISLALTDVLICFEMVFFAIGHQYAFSHTDYIDRRSTYAARMPFGYAFRDSFGMRDVLEDTKATLAGEGMDYKEFEPAEGFIHQGAGRERRIKAGLRYADGGKKKYWLPMPAEETEPNNFINRLGHHLKRHDSEEVFAPLLEEQADEVIHDAPVKTGSDESDDEFPVGNGRESDEDDILKFPSPSASCEDLYARGRQHLFGDAHYPAIDVSAESARREMWEEEERILKNQRGAYFSPRHQERKLYFAQREYGTNAPGRPDLSRESTRGNGVDLSRESSNSKSKGKGKLRLEGDERELIVNRDDERLPDIEAGGVSLKWTRHNKLRPGSASARPKSREKEGGRATPPGRKTPIDDRHSSSSPPNSNSLSASGSGSSSSSPRTRKRTLSKPTDAVDLIVEDPEAAEKSMARERMRGEPAVRGSGLRKVYRREYVIEDSDGEEKEVDIEEQRDVADKKEDDIPEATKVEFKDKQSGVPDGGAAGEEEAAEEAAEEPHGEITTEVQVVRETAPPPHARIEVRTYENNSDEGGNPWS